MPDPSSPLDELAKNFYSDPAPPATQPEPGQWFDRYAVLRSDLTKHAASLHDTLGVPATAREADDRAFVKLADELGFDDQTLLTLHDQVVRGLMQSAPDPDADETAAVQARNVTIRQMLRERLGEAAADDVIARTERFIDATPALQQLVESGATATRAEPFLILAEHVQRHHIR